MTDLQRHPDRLLPADPGTRAIARRVLGESADLPIVSPHGHVDPQLLLQDRPFRDPAALFVTPDHYVTRLLHAHGVPLDELGVPVARRPNPTPPREVWRVLCMHWRDFLGTPSRYWLEEELALVLGVRTVPSPETADDLYDEINDRLATPEFRPRALFRRFGIETLATTDDPVDDLAVHRALTAELDVAGRVIPTFRADRYLDPARPGWARDVDILGDAAACDIDTYPGFIAALERRREHFRAAGATATDSSPVDADTTMLGTEQAAGVYARARDGAATGEECVAFRRHMTAEMARMSCDDGLVMQLHPGVLRNHHPPTYQRFGADAGHDIPVAIEFTRALRPMLERFGTHPNFRTVLFTVDEDTWSREIAPLAGFYPSVYVGAPWWFLDSPDAMRRFRETVTDTAGFYRTSGFVDDTRAFCSIPARHDAARRIDAGHLARLAVEHRISEDDAAQTARDLAYSIPKHVFRL